MDSTEIYRPALSPLYSLYNQISQSNVLYTLYIVLWPRGVKLVRWIAGSNPAEGMDVSCVVPCS